MISENYSKLKCFVLFANTNHEIWKMLIGQKVLHNTLSTGVIEDVVEINFKPQLRIRFDKTPEILRKFGESILIDGLLSFSEMDFFEIEEFGRYYKEKKDEENRKQEQTLIEEKRMQEQLLRDAAVLKEYNSLKVKYGISSKTSLPISSPLFSILKNLEYIKPLNVADSRWLEDNFPSVYYEHKYLWTDDIWDLIKSSSYWRKLGEPQRAIELLELKTSTDKKTMSAILTVMGGANKDLNELELAEFYAYDALKHCENCYQPYTLLGAIYYQKGLPAEGDNYFYKAKELGSKLDLDFMIKEALKRAEEGERVLSARYLLKKDSWKYKWAENYIK